MARVLVTGASGFIGAHLAAALAARGDEVACLVRASSSLARLEGVPVRPVLGDCTDPSSLASAVAETDQVYHLAGVTKSLSIEGFRRVNELGVANLVEACARQTSPPTVVVVSSLAAAGPAPADRLRHEDDPPQPVSRYGRSKRAGELAAQAWAHQVPISVVRPPIVFGEGDTSMLEMIRPIMRLGVHAVPGRGRARFSLVHAADLVQALLLAAERGVRLEPPSEGQHSSTGYYYVAADEHPTYGDLGRLVAAAVGRRVLVLPLPPAATWIGGAGSELLWRMTGRSRIFNLDKAREALAGSWACTPERAREQLGFAPAADLPSHMQRTIDWYRAQGWI